MTRHTPEQAAILALLTRVEALEAENQALNARVSSVVAQLRAAAAPPGGHLALVKKGLQARGTRR